MALYLIGGFIGYLAYDRYVSQKETFNFAPFAPTAFETSMIDLQLGSGPKENVGKRFATQHGLPDRTSVADAEFGIIQDLLVDFKKADTKATSDKYRSAPELPYNDRVSVLSPAGVNLLSPDLPIQYMDNSISNYDNIQDQVLSTVGGLVGNGNEDPEEIRRALRTFLNLP